jgi:hypothetical protein
MSVEVEVAGVVTAELVEAFGRLVPQLSSTAKPLSREALARVLPDGASTVLIARAEGRVVGTLTLVMFSLPTGLRARIEDVVVDETARPSRQAANRLYERLGFQARDSRVYRLVLS